MKILPINLTESPSPFVIFTLENRTLSPAVERFIQCTREVGKLIGVRSNGLTDLGHEIPPRDEQTPEALDEYQKAEINKWWPIIKAANTKEE